MNYTKWAIKITPENYKEIGEFYDKSCGGRNATYNSTTWYELKEYLGSHNSFEECILDDSLKKKSYSFSCGDSKYPLITIEEFRELINKKEVDYEIY